METADPLTYVQRRKIRWGSVLFLGAVTLVAVVGAPLYAMRYGVSASEWALFAFYFAATSFATTIGYHRLFSHASFEAHPWVRFFLLFFGAATFQQSALKWASLHRTHHRFTDTHRDPYNIKRGFFHAHVGWILFYKQSVDYENVSELKHDPLVTHQHAHYRAWSLVAGLFVPLAIGAMTGHLLGAFVFAVALRLFLVLNSAFFINSFAHTFGEGSYDLESSAKDHWLGAILTNGEGYHNYHHRFPGDYRNGTLWHHWDPTKWAIWLLSRIGLAKNLRSTPTDRIREAVPPTA